MSCSTALPVCAICIHTDTAVTLPLCCWRLLLVRPGCPTVCAQPVCLQCTHAAGWWQVQQHGSDGGLDEQSSSQWHLGCHALVHACHCWHRLWHNCLVRTHVHCHPQCHPPLSVCLTTAAAHRYWLTDHYMLNNVIGVSFCCLILKSTHLSTVRTGFIPMVRVTRAQSLVLLLMTLLSSLHSPPPPPDGLVCV